MSLRRLDWRFLLPAPPHGRFCHLLLGGGQPDLANTIIAAGLAERVSSEITKGDRYDAAVLLHDSPISTKQAALALETGGAFYQEIARQTPAALRMTPRRIEKHLYQSGLSLTGLYWAAPDFDHCRRYIPLDTAGALQWYFSSLFVAGTPAHFLVQTFLRRFIGKSSARMGWLAPCLSVTAVAAIPSAPPPALLPSPSLLNHPHIRDLLPDAEVRPLLLTSGQDDASRVIMLPFATSAGESPAAVIKIATDPAFNAETEEEQSVLREVRAQLDPATRSSVPVPLATFRHYGLAVAVESRAEGHSLWRSSGGWNVAVRDKIADLQLGTAWLIAFHKQTQSKHLTWDEEAIVRWVEEPLAAYARLHNMSGTVGANDETDAALFSMMRQQAKLLAGTQLPLVWQHHDFAPWNLFRSGDKLTVIDWEFNRSWDETRTGPPLCDLLYFLTYWSNLVHRHYDDRSELDGLYRLFIAVGDRTNNNQFIEASHRALAQYMSALAIESRFLPLLLVHTWMERVLYSHARARKLGRPSTTSRAAAKFASYVRLFATHAGQLFSTENDQYWQQQMRAASSSPANAPATEVLS